MCVWVGRGGGRVRMQEDRQDFRKEDRETREGICVWVGGCECRTTERTTQRWGRGMCGVRE